MCYLVGTDEAGYAPNLGPLVISATVWHVADAAIDVDLYKKLKAVVCRQPSRRAPKRRLAIADSKVLYSPVIGLGQLERSVLAALTLAGKCPLEWSEAWQLLDRRSTADLAAQPWHATYDCPLPLAADRDDLTELFPKLKRGLAQAGVSLVGMFSRAVFPDRMNRTSRELGNKSEALSAITLELLGEALSLCRGEPVLVVCDKHGGRNRYGRHLQRQFPETLVEVYRESTALSIYRFTAGSDRVEVRFQVGGERFLPAALASMTSKYLRELSMHAFNEFWCTRVESLAPTAGYPRDSKRFRAAIEPARQALGIDDAILWARAMTMMLYIVRHAYSGERGDPRYPNDNLRPLTREGRELFERLVKHIARGKFAPTLLATSPLVRCRQTADALAKRLDKPPKIEEVACLEPGGSLEKLIAWSNRQDAEQIAWVGHAPDVDEMAAALLGTDDSAFRFAKGAIAAIEFRDKIAAGRGTLRWLVTPKLLAK